MIGKLLNIAFLLSLHCSTFIGGVGCFLQSWISQACVKVSMLTITAFTVERYLAICHPFAAQVMSNMSRVIVLISAIWLLSVLCSLPPSWPTRLDAYGPVSACLFDAHILPNVLEITQVLFFFVPSTFILVLHILIVIKLVKSRQVEGKSAHSPPANRRIFIMLVKNVSAATDSLKELESLDERNDALIFRSVVESMSEWEEKRARHHGAQRVKREVSRVCYEDFGCFEDTGPFGYLEMLPSPPKEVGTRFFVYGSRKARSIPMEVPAEDINSMSSNAIDPELPTKILVHGFGSSCDQVWVYEIRAALRSVMECNIVCVDWGPGSAVPNYVRAAANARLVGRQLAKLVRSLDVPMDKVHLIGFSLGAHVAGFAGAELGNVSRITGLDPAGPLFEAQDPRARLDESDAHFVDVIHSNGEQLILGGLGSWQPMGDVDFYPNGGRMQTGCSNIFLGAVSDIIWSNPVEGRSLCNHRRAYKLFTDSVSPKCRFPAFPCEKGYDGLLKGECFPCGTHPDKPCGDMGFYSDQSQARGQLYLLTRDEEPFCAHQYQIKLYNSKHERPVKSYGKLQVTLLSDAAMNETFTMTKKDDEELLVGKTLQKIIVPHPALSNLDAIEIKYTAYSGWISSGLVSWSVDKVSVTDSYGTIHSVCRRGLVLESGIPNYLPLYRGDCSVPPEQDDQDNNANNTAQQQVPILKEDNNKGIGPFTKEHNYDRTAGKDVPQKGLGPFTKQQNIKIANEQAKLAAAKKEFSEKFSKTLTSAARPWSLAEVPIDGNSNSVENNNIADLAERGRGFSSLSVTRAAVVAKSSSSSSDSSSLEQQSWKKKESARSLRLAEITEPVLRPRATRNDNAKSLQMQDRKQESMQQSPSSNAAFTVQFLPERLAGILAQAERYARQTLLPLISQYTPSFMAGGRSDRPKYFPPLGHLFGLKDDGETGKKIGDSNDSRTKYYIDFEEPTSTTPTSSSSTQPDQAIASSSTSSIPASEQSDSDWLPLSVQPLQHNRKDKSMDAAAAADVPGEWINEGDSNWTPKSNDSQAAVSETKIDDWVPLLATVGPNDNSSSEHGKFIPLLDLASKQQTSADKELHEKKVAQARSIVFPYLYERKNDPRTRYIPLIPEEDLGLAAANKEEQR